MNRFSLFVIIAEHCDMGFMYYRRNILIYTQKQLWLFLEQRLRWGIENLYYAYILVEKGEELDNILMQERYWFSVLAPVRFVLLLKTIFSRKIVL